MKKVLLAILVFMAFFSCNQERNEAEKAFNQGEEMYNSKNKIEAIKFYNKSIELDSTFAPGYFGRGKTKVDLGKKMEAREAMVDYDIAISLDTNYAIAYYYRGLLNEIWGNHEKAISDFDNAIKLGQNTADIYFNRAISKSKLGYLNKESILDFNKAIQLNPKTSNYYFQRGVFYNDIELNNEALADFKNTLKLNPKFSESYTYIGTIINQRGDKKGACEVWTKAVELGNTRAKLLINYYCK